jgi:hypothetical protein
MSPANIGPNLFLHIRRLMTDIDAALEQQVFDVPERQRKRTYIITTSRITSGDELKYWNGLAAYVGEASPDPTRPLLTVGAFALTEPPAASRGDSAASGGGVA